MSAQPARRTDEESARRSADHGSNGPAGEPADGLGRGTANGSAIGSPPNDSHGSSGDGESDIDALKARRIRSFVTRAGRISPAQQRALDALLPVYGIPYAPAALELGAWPTVLEIGFGMGDASAEIAAAHPELNFIGVEVHTPGIGALLKQIDERGLKNLRIVTHDAVEVVERMVAPGALAGVHIFFPDPWQKARHHKRRLIAPEFVATLADRLSTGGYLHCATDWHDYAEQMLEVLGGEPRLVNAAQTFASRDNPLVVRPQTKFERRGLKLGHGVWDLVFLKR